MGACGADPAAIASLYERRFHAFVGGAYTVVGEPEAARDAMQEAFARALRDRRRFRGEGTLEAWLWRVSNDPRTLDKAVTFDFPTSGSDRVIIFPELNETYIDSCTGRRCARSSPTARRRDMSSPDRPLQREAAGDLKRRHVTVHLPGGLTRSMSWHAGDSFVTVEDTTAEGTTTTRVSIGHELPLVPFK
jgi:Sigma-70 region 2